MSLSIGLHIGPYVIFVSDCRETLHTGDSWTRHRAYRETVKLVRTSVGLLSGVGLCRLLHAVRDRVLDDEPRSFDALAEIISEEREAIATDPRARAGDKRHALERTGWILTFGALTEAGEPDVCFLTYHPDVGGFGQVVPGGHIAFVPYSRHGDPGGISERLCEEIGQALSEHDPDVSIEDHVEYTVAVLRAAVEACAADAPTVGRECQIGLHFPDGSILVSEILAPDDPVVWLPDE